MDNLSDFSETLSELMDERKLTTEALGAAIGISGASVRYWKERKQKLNLSNALKLADFFECSLEFLMGRTDVRLGYTQQSRPAFYDSLMRVMKEQGKSRYRIMKDTSFSSGCFSQWKSGSDPLMETVINLADYLNCTLDYLVGREI